MLLKRRPTLKGLMIAIAVIGVGIAAVILSNKFWAFVLPIFYMTTLLTAILGSLFRRGRERAYWIGFALFGGAYATYFLRQDNFLIGNTSFKDIINQPVSFLIKLVMSMGLVREVPGDIGHGIADLTSLLSEMDEESPLFVAWSLLGLVFAGLGGLIARAFYRDEPTPTRRDNPSNPVRGADP
jgi:hypothetical protein